MIKNARLRPFTWVLFQRSVCLTLCAGFPSVSVLSLNLHSLGVLMNKWNNVRVWGRQSTFWEYLWCLAQHCSFLLLTAPIHPQGQYAVLVAATNQRRWEISSGPPAPPLPPGHTEHHRKCFDIMTHQDTKMFAMCLICLSKGRKVCRGRIHEHIGPKNHREKHTD